MAGFDGLQTRALNNGSLMPGIGFGVFQAPPEQTVDAVTAALACGYRHIDTAASYLNEREVGQAIAQSDVARDDVFVESKVWISDYGFESTMRAVEVSRAKLGVERIDLMLLHQALPGRFDLTVAAYRALERLLADGVVGAIGVSNFMADHLDRLLAEVEVVPAVNQVEYHAYFQQSAVADANAARGIATQAWSPIGGITFYRDSGVGRSTLDDPTIAQIASRHDKSPAQIMLRWHIESGRQPIVKSVNPARMRENLDIFDFSLSPDDAAAINALNTGVRGGNEPDAYNLDDFAIDIPST
ncbi:aldo/keto reductase [Gordonia hydrophobica]|nr:aldo/keto reductase [Gordonia hydrophobica]MBM7365410.1 diketogulonate reductase-like aldo/keto reductase [Gordonia hydrophobica]